MGNPINLIFTLYYIYKILLKANIWIPLLAEAYGFHLKEDTDHGPYSLICLTYHRCYNLGVKKCYIHFIWSSKSCDSRKVILADFVVITAVPW